ncbi:3-oxoacyl-ACP reductase family protein [Pseudomonas sp. X10]
MILNRFQSKVALVTGGSRGIGAAIVRRLAQEGARVAFTYASSDSQAHALVASLAAEGAEALAIKADSGSQEDIENAVAATLKAFGALHILVNNAGRLSVGTLDDFSVEALDELYAINVRAAFIAAKACSRVMEAGARIITIGSVAAQRSAFPGSSGYSMTKAAVAGMIRALAIDLAPRGITVNNIQPGPTATDMTPEDSAVHDLLVNLIPLGRLGKADEVASVAAYLASEESSFVTGASFTVDGGYLA